jgi:hypothetical protein|tara:strand:+ start:433 stop:678 length:246 start_codon:yes stop_codon:yes gene_type:complete
MRLNASQPITNNNGEMEQTFRSWALEVSNNLPLVGTGSPEGVIEAAQYSLYIDKTTPLSPVQYRKMLSDIGGNRTKGWAVV